MITFAHGYLGFVAKAKVTKATIKGGLLQMEPAIILSALKKKFYQTAIIF